MSILRRLLAVGSAVLVGAALAVPTAAAAGSVPAVGECYPVTNEQTYSDYWPSGLAAVSCDEEHSIQITKSSVLPADVNAVDFAAQHCDYRSVWSDLGINQGRNGVVPRPVRIESFFFVVRGDGAMPSYVCGAGPVEYRGAKDFALVSMTGAIESMTPTQRAGLQFCSSAADGRGTRQPITVPCTSRPRWQVTKWILWDDFYRSYPGYRVLERRARTMCGPGTVQSVPTAKDWPGGTHRTWCYVKVR